MAYNTIHHQNLVDSVQRWLRAQGALVETVSAFAGGWEGWARNQFAMWLQADLRSTPSNGGAQNGTERNNEPLDVLTEMNLVRTPEGTIPVFENPKARADLLFNALSDRRQPKSPPIIVMELKCQTPKRPWSAFRAGLIRDVAKLYTANPELDDIDRGNAFLIAAGISFNVDGLRPVAGFHLERATDQYAVQWWSDPEVMVID